MVRRCRGGREIVNGVVGGMARVDQRTKRLIGRLQAGEVAVIDHEDLDRVAAEGLVEARVGAVLNAAASTSGKYPNLGPLVLTSAGIPLVDRFGPDLFERIHEGDPVRIEAERVFIGHELVAKGELVTRELAKRRLDDLKRDISSALERFAENTLEYMRTEREILLEAVRLPETRVEFAGRHVLVVVRGYGYKSDLASLRGYIRDFRPIRVGVDGGADALLELGLRPDIIIGDMDSVTNRALRCGAELILHAYADGRAPGRERLEALGLAHATFEAPGTSEDIALLLAHEKGAELIVEVGARASLIELLDKGRKGMASTFLVRLRVGPKLVDAKGVSQLHRPGPTTSELIALVGAAVATMAILAVVAAEPSLVQLVGASITLWLKNLAFAIRQAIT